ncbi:MAG TPA: MFS transporter, partial [Polyangiaceae bacterium]|nr:MFS transporter [Polyangiaceae bacterium]
PFGSLWATTEIGMSSRVLGLFMTVNSLSAIAIGTALGRWSDSHIPRRTLLLIGAGAGVIGNVGYAFVREPLLLTLIGSTALGLAAMNFAQLFAHVREEIGRSEGADAPFLMGVLRACYALAWTVGPNLGAALKGSFGYRGLFLATAGFFVLLIGCVLAFVARRPRDAAAVGARAAPGAREAAPGGREAAASSTWSAWGLGQPGVLAHCVAFGLMFAAFTLNGLNLPLFLTKKLGGNESGVALAFAISPACEMAFMVGFGHLAAKGYQRAVIVLGTSAAVCYFLVLGLVSAPWHVYPLQVLNASAVAVVTSVAIPYFQDLLPRQVGIATSLYSGALKAGALLGFAAFGLAASRVESRGLFLVCATFALGTVSLISFATRPAPRAVEAPTKATP